MEDDLHYAVELMRALREPDDSFPGVRFEIDLTADPAVALEHSQRDDIDIYIVDLKFRSKGSSIDDPEIGRLLTKQIAERTNAGLIIHSSMPLEDEGADALAAGADDYIEKGSRMGDFSDIGMHRLIRSKVAALWRRAQITRPGFAEKFSHAGRRFQLGLWTYTIGERELADNAGQRVKLSHTENAFLRYLCIVEDHEIDRENFNVNILGRNRSARDKRIDGLVYKLRVKLGPTVHIVSKGDGMYKLLDLKEIRSKIAV